jgi:hypothetical protein
VEDELLVDDEVEPDVPGVYVLSPTFIIISSLRSGNPNRKLKPVTWLLEQLQIPAGKPV